MHQLTLELLRDILLEAEFLADQVAQTTFNAFIQDEVKKRAFVRSLEIIGEAAKTRLSSFYCLTGWGIVDHELFLKQPPCI